MDQIISKIKAAQHLLLASHSDPDGDAISSVLALGLALNKLDKKVTLYNASPIPAVYRFLPSVENIVDRIKKAKTSATCLRHGEPSRCRLPACRRSPSRERASPRSVD